MTRKPVDQLIKEPKPQGQDGIWAEIRHLNIFSLSDITRATDISKATVWSYVKRLVAGGYVEEHSELSDGTKRYILRRDPGIHAPRLKSDGTPVTQGGGVKNMWRSMRALGQFSPRDLAVHSTTDTVEVSMETAKTYCSMLLKAKYLRVMQKANPGRQAVYKLIRNTGPQPPQIQRVKQVFDPNLNEVTYYPGVRQ